MSKTFKRNCGGAGKLHLTAAGTVADAHERTRHLFTEMIDHQEKVSRVVHP